MIELFFRLTFRWHILSFLLMLWSMSWLRFLSFVNYDIILYQHFFTKRRLNECWLQLSWSNVTTSSASVGHRALPMVKSSNEKQLEIVIHWRGLGLELGLAIKEGQHIHWVGEDSSQDGCCVCSKSLTHSHSVSSVIMCGCVRSSKLLWKVHNIKCCCIFTCIYLYLRISFEDLFMVRVISR